MPTFYPKKGFGQIAEKILNEFKKSGGKIKLNEEVINISNLKNQSFKVKTNISEYKADILISTLPLDYLIKIFHPHNKNNKLLHAANNLKYLALIIVYLVIKKKNILKCQYCYFVGRPYNRISELNLFSDEITNKETSVLSLEISCHFNKDIWKKEDSEILSLCVKNLEKDKIIGKEDIIDWKIIKVPNVYPIYSIDHEKNLNIVKTHLKKIQNCYSIGRLGQFYYGDIDQMMRIGFDTANKIN